MDELIASDPGNVDENLGLSGRKREQEEAKRQGGNRGRINAAPRFRGCRIEQARS
jgi:hypothetical protein